MKEVTKYELLDGSVYNTLAEARRKADVKYTSEAAQLTAKLLRHHQNTAYATKFQAVKDFIHDNLDSFINLKALRDDMEVSNQEEEE